MVPGAAPDRIEHSPSEELHDQRTATGRRGGIGRAITDAAPDRGHGVACASIESCLPSPGASGPSSQRPLSRVAIFDLFLRGDVQHC